jgi:hypothetical protein
MRHELRFKPTADERLTYLENYPAHKGTLQQVRKTLGYLETNLRAKSLQTHPHESLTRRYGVRIFEAYAQQHTPGAYRVYWHYGPDEKAENGKRIPIITIVAIIPHP